MSIRVETTDAETFLETLKHYTLNDVRIQSWSWNNGLNAFIFTAEPYVRFCFIPHTFKNVVYFIGHESKGSTVSRDEEIRYRQHFSERLGLNLSNFIIRMSKCTAEQVQTIAQGKNPESF